MRSKSLRWTFIIVSISMLVSVGAAPAAAEIQGFMKIPGLPGESQVEGHVGDIDLMSYMQSATTKTCFNAVAVKGLDTASPGLALLAVGKQLLPMVTVALTRTVGDRPVEVFTALLENVSVVSVELSEFDGGPAPVERVTLQPRRATLSYRPQNPDGTIGSPVTRVVDCQ